MRPAPPDPAPAPQALEQAREKGDTIKDEIWRELARAKYTCWQLQSCERREQQQVLRQQLQELMAAQREAAIAGGPEAAGLLRQRQEGEMRQWERLFAAAGQQDCKLEVPSACTCPLTMEVYRDPARACGS
jgi:STIP1 family protein 1